MIIMMMKRNDMIEVITDQYNPEKKKVSNFADLALATGFVRKVCAARIRERICLEDYTVDPPRLMHYEKGIPGHSFATWCDEDGVGHDWKFKKLTEAETARFSDLLIAGVARR